MRSDMHNLTLFHSTQVTIDFSMQSLHIMSGFPEEQEMMRPPQLCGDSRLAFDTLSYKE